uniref:DNA-directed RNA polymerase subunit alpha n=1 Tax=Sykidion marinum TaxID=44573 RepID=A0A1W6EGI9_SYKMA|nr:alpha subunit of RNA polymerase [Pseudoneochloris marina]ARK14514.1 alpha subunit of RNA polymerase [Pseudoneochloris marina]
MNYTFLSCIDSQVEHPTKFYGRFEIGPFAPGQGLTVANALRRSLLSQLPGVALTLVEIKGASHEYETLPGVRESILDILLNLKQLVLTSDFDVFTPQVGVLNVKGPGIIRARDLKLPFFIYSIDPDQYIATLTEKGSLTMKFLVSCGKNHLTHTPSHTDFSELVTLLKQNQPYFHSDNDLESQLQLTQELDDVNKKNKKNKSQNQSERSTLTEQENQTYQQPSLDIKLNKTNLYQKWKNERKLTKNVGQENLLKTKNLEKKNSLKNQLNFQNAFLTENGLKNTQKNLNNKKSFSTLNEIKNSAFLTETESNRSLKIGYFPIDAIFMPVTRVNYLINSDTGNTLIKETILLEIWTNGSVHPRHAIHKAAKALIQLFLPLQQMRTSVFQIAEQKSNQNALTLPSPFSDGKTTFLNGTQNFLNPSIFDIKQKQQKRISLSITEKQVSNQKINQNSQLESEANTVNNSNTINEKALKSKLSSFSKKKFLELDIGNLDLTARPYSALKQAGIHIINDLISKPKTELLEIKNFGQRSLKDVEKALAAMGLELRN